MKDVSRSMGGRQGRSKIAYVVVSVFLLVLAAFVFFGLNESCGNGICRPDSGETCRTCPSDCGQCGNEDLCGDGMCDSGIGETCGTCPEDCGDCPKAPECGDSVCDPFENCWDCPRDCKCGEEEYCSKRMKECIKPFCGNGECEIFENSAKCCIDCPCEITYTKCNPETKACEFPPTSLGNEDIREIVASYYMERSMEVEEIMPREVLVWGGKVGRKTEVRLSGRAGLEYLLVTDEKEIIVLPLL